MGGELFTQDQFGGAPANVHHQSALIRLWQQPGNALVDQSRFLQPGNDVDVVAQHFAATLKKLFAVACFTQGLGGHGANLGTGKVCQPFGKTGKAVPAALHGLVTQVVFTVQAIALAHGFLEVFDTLDVAVRVAADFKAKAVGA